VKQKRTVHLDLLYYTAQITLRQVEDEWDGYDEFGNDVFSEAWEVTEIKKMKVDQKPFSRFSVVESGSFDDIMSRRIQSTRKMAYEVISAQFPNDIYLSTCFRDFMEDSSV